MPESELNLKEMCARFEVTPRTLRYYEYIELLTPRKVGRARFYGPREIARTTLILRGRRFGFSLEDIRQWLELYDAKGSTDQYRALIGMADRQIAELERRRSELTSAIEELRALRDATERDLK
jgi:DNA-binding transcriptional MerR regulator